MGKIEVLSGGMGRFSRAGRRERRLVRWLSSASGLAPGCALSLLSFRAPVRKGRAGFLGSARREEARGRPCVRARVSSGAPGFCLSHNVTLEEEAGRASSTFLPPLRLSSSPPTPSFPSSASCRHLHNKSPQVLGGERAGRAPVTKAPQRQRCSADLSEKQP